MKYYIWGVILSIIAVVILPFSFNHIDPWFTIGVCIVLGGIIINKIKI